MGRGGRVDRRTKVLEFADDETTEYANLSHRWIDLTEVDYEEMVDLTRMDREERDEIRQRLSYKKILDSCEQARRTSTLGCGWHLLYRQTMQRRPIRGHQFHELVV